MEYADENGIMDYVVEDMAFVLDLPEKIITDETAFEKYYQPYIDEMKEEEKRKKQLIDKIVKSVPDEGNIKRSELIPADMGIFCIKCFRIFSNCV